MKSILQSIKPQYCELIASGKKTIEVRKTKPKIPTPFKVYIYETRAECDRPIILDCGRLDFHGRGQVIGEYICDEIKEYPYVEGEEVNEKVYQIPTIEGEKTCLDYPDFVKYANGKTVYFWHISDIKIYDKPKYLSEFCVIDKNKLKECPYRERICQNPEFTNGNYLLGGYSCSKTKKPDFDDIDFCRGGCADVFKSLTHPPHSWCYIEEV